MSEETQLVTIVIPVFQGEAFVAEAIDSVLKQTFRNLEVIVVNDCSTDSTSQILKSYEGRDQRLRVIDLPVNRGVHEARAHGVSASRGDSVGFVDADDFIEPDCIERMVQSMASADADIVICGIRFCSPSGTVGGFKVRFSGPQVIDKDILTRFCSLDFGTGSLCNKLFRRGVIEQYATASFGEELTINEDYLVNFGAFLAAKRVFLLPDALYFYRQHPSSVTQRGAAAERFSKMIRAYVIGLETYAHAGSDARDHIDMLYSNQLRFPCYRIEDVDELDRWFGHLGESIVRLAKVHPAALYRMCHLYDVSGAPSAGLVSRTKRFLGQFFAGRLN